MKIFNKSFYRTLAKLQQSFLVENRQNKKMLDIYIKYAEGNASDEELDSANEQLKQILKNLGLGLLIILPFSPITLPYIFSKAKELEIDLIPNWYKSLSNEDDRLEQVSLKFFIDTIYVNIYLQRLNIFGEQYENCSNRRQRQDWFS